MALTIIRRISRVLLALAAGVLAPLSQAAAFQQSSVRVGFSASAWPEADRLFRMDPRWRGCESAVSLKLADGRILWMFSESKIDPTQSESSHNTLTIHNSLALQIGTDPKTAELVHFWDMTRRRPGPYIRDGSGFWHWPADGIEIGSSLMLLLFKVRPGKKARGPEIIEWSVARIVNAQDSPARWRIQWIPTPANQFHAVLGIGGLVHIGGYLVTGAQLPDQPGELFLVRWPLDRIVRYDFTTPQWWTKDKGWVSQESLDVEPTPVASDLTGALRLHWDSTRDRAFIFASQADQPGVIHTLQAPVPTGPWSDPEELISLDPDIALNGVSLSLCRGLRSDATVLSAVPLLSSASSGAFPRLIRIWPR